jgi:hypothetical protein
MTDNLPIADSDDQPEPDPNLTDLVNDQLVEFINMHGGVTRKHANTKGGAQANTLYFTNDGAFTVPRARIEKLLQAGEIEVSTTPDTFTKARRALPRGKSTSTAKGNA